MMFTVDAGTGAVAPCLHTGAPAGIEALASCCSRNLPCVRELTLMACVLDDEGFGTVARSLAQNTSCRPAQAPCRPSAHRAPLPPSPSAPPASAAQSLRASLQTSVRPPLRPTRRPSILAASLTGLAPCVRRTPNTARVPSFRLCRFGCSALDASFCRLSNAAVPARDTHAGGVCGGAGRGGLLRVRA